MNQHISMDYAGRHVLVMGLGVHGGGLGVARFMARNGARVRVTDLRTTDQLRSSIEALEREGLQIEYTLGEHREEDLRWADVVVRNPGVPKESPWLALARSLGKPIEMEMSIFLRLCPAPVAAVTGTKGKSTTATWAWEMLRHWRPDAVLAGNLRVSALDALPRIKTDTPVVLELSSWQLEGLQEPRISPHIGAVTNLSQDHMDRYNSMEEYGQAKKLIFLNQRPERADWAVLNACDPVVSRWAGEAPAGVAWFSTCSQTPADGPGVFLVGGELRWHAPTGEQVALAAPSEIHLPGEHNLANAACAATMAILAGAPYGAVRSGLRSFRGVPDRLEFLTMIGGVGFYNDTTSTTPASTIAALHALQGPIVLIAGGADKGLDFAELAQVAAQRTYAVVLLEGTATDRMERQLYAAGARVLGRYDDFEQAVRDAWSATPVGGIVLLSPATASFGMFRNEFDRGERFRVIVAQLATSQPSTSTEA